MTNEEREYYRLTEKVFTKLAPFYDYFVAPASGVRTRTVNCSGAKPGSKVLDVATGTGKLAFAFAHGGFDVHGIDISSAMLEVAKRKNTYDNLVFENADATKLRFENGVFDVCSISFALHDMPEGIRKKVLKEMIRVTKPEGVIMIVDYALPESGLLRFLFYHLIKLYEGKYYRNFIHLDVRKMLLESGIEITEETPVLSGAGTILKCRKKTS